MVTPYLVFCGNCKDALEFYQNVFKCEAGTSIPYGEYVPEGISMPPENLHDWVLHAEMQICGTKFWFADEVSSPARDGMVRLTVTVPDAKTAQDIYDALCVNGVITLPPTETFYSTFHAALTDKFGVGWNIVAEEALVQG